MRVSTRVWAAGLAAAAIAAWILGSRVHGGSPERTASTSGEARLRIAESFGGQPLHFEANRGQTDEQVKFLSRGPGYALYLTPAEAVLVLSRRDAVDGGPGPVAPPDGPPAPRTGREPDAARKTAVLRMKLVGAEPEPRMEGLAEEPATVNYLLGDDPAVWSTDVPTYAKVGCRDVYPGIDLVYYGNQRQLEYDFVVSPGADPEDIAIRFEGADGLEIDDEGNLVVHTAGGDVHQKRPVVYQEAEGAREAISGSYVLGPEDRVGFRIGMYDPGRPLVIDPTVVYSTYLGGTGDDFGLGVAVDASGCAYVTGFASSWDFPVTSGALQSTLRAGYDVFVTKLDPTGSAIIYSTYIGGSLDDHGLRIELDVLGNAYVVGYTLSANFPVTSGALQTGPGGGQDAFVLMLDASGSTLLYSTYLGGSLDDVGRDIVVDAQCNAYVVGDTSSVDFPITTGVLQSSNAGAMDAFVAKLNPAGSALLYSTYLGGSFGAGSSPGVDYGYGIAVDAAGCAYVTGSTWSWDFPVTTGAFLTTCGGAADAYVAKLNASASALVYSTYLHGPSGDYAYAIAVDPAACAYVTGRTFSTSFPTTSGAFQRYFGGGYVDAFVTKLNATGSALLYSTFLGGDRWDCGFDIALDAAGNAHVAGTTRGHRFPTTLGAFQRSWTEDWYFDGFMTKLDATGSLLLYSTLLGDGPRSGDPDESCRGIALGPGGEVYLTGVAPTSTGSFPVTPGAFQTVFGGGRSDGFVTKFAPQAPYCWAWSDGRVYEYGVESVTLRGEAADVDGDLLSYQWRRADGSVLFSGTVRATAGATPVSVRVPDHTVATSWLGFGDHWLTLAVNDGTHAEATSTTRVRVGDTRPPTLSPVVTPDVLWPPDHDLVSVTVETDPRDSSGAMPRLWVAVASNEADDGLGDGDTSNDIQDLSVDQSTGIVTLSLRAERSGKGGGRIYTITIYATDAGGNTATASVEVKVPINQGK